MSDDDFQIELGQSVRRHIESGTSPLKDPALCAAAYDDPASDRTPVFIAEDVMRRIEQQVHQHKDREVGGVLLGDFYRGDKASFIKVVDFIEAAEAKGTDVSLTFTHEAWEQINAEHARRCPNLAIVGWYHSHPALGVFMSREDEFIHSSFFTDPWHIALVVDPVYHNWGCFKWHDGHLQRTAGFYVYAPKKAARQVRDYVGKLAASRQAAPSATSASADRRQTARGGSNLAMWALVILLIVAQGITGFILMRGHVARPEPDYKAEAIRLLSYSDLTGGENCLRMHLTAHPNDMSAYKELSRVQQAVEASASQPDGHRMDMINFSLAAADRMASGMQEFDRPSDFEALRQPSKEDAGKARLQAADPVKNALKVYESAESTRAARLRRAKTIAGAIGYKSLRDGHWWTRAVNAIQGESLHEIAYGLQSGLPEYQARYDRLNSGDRAAVKRIRTGLLKEAR